jgi:hypothetical protein
LFTVFTTFHFAKQAATGKIVEFIHDIICNSRWHVLINVPQLPSFKNVRIPTSIYPLDLAIEQYLRWQNMVWYYQEKKRKKNKMASLYFTQTLKKIKWLHCISLKLWLPCYSCSAMKDSSSYNIWWWLYQWVRIHVLEIRWLWRVCWDSKLGSKASCFIVYIYITRQLLHRGPDFPSHPPPSERVFAATASYIYHTCWHSILIIQQVQPPPSNLPWLRTDHWFW